jgi:photosystem II stability/assembly factor-like uncharacterized protein
VSSKVLVLIGTRKGAFILESDARRQEWGLRGPFCEAWPINHFIADPARATLHAGGGSEWYGAAVWRSADLGATWSHSSEGLNYGEDGPDLKTVWSVAPSNGTLYAGVEPAGLFASQDGGDTWSHVRGLREHPSRPNWMPGNGGLCLHSIVPHPTDHQQVWVGISAVGTFHTSDGGATWTPQNRGVRADFLPDKYPETGQCVHNLQLSPSQPERLYQQNHCGVYRSDDGGAYWQEISAGLPSDFGFPVAVHPRQSETLYVIPLSGEDNSRTMPEGKTAVWRSRDGGECWERLTAGLPQEHAHLGVLRQGMAADRLDPAGIYFGTSTGHVFASADEGESWTEIASYLPAILSVEVAVMDV